MLRLLKVASVASSVPDVLRTSTKILSNCVVVVVSLDVEKDWLGRLRLRGARSRAWRQALVEAAAAGAGEILLTSVDREGTLGGMDVALIEQASAMVDVPLIANGGASSLDDIQAAVKAGASAVAAGAFFVFHGPHRAVLITYPRYEELRELWERTAA